MQDVFALASVKNFRYLNQRVSELLAIVFNTDKFSYRELVLTGIVGKFLYQNLNIQMHFSQCNPRALCEGEIRSFFLKHCFPCVMSCVLNIAKAVEAIDFIWAAKRRPKAVADATVELFAIMNGMSEQELLEMAAALVQMYIKEAEKVKKQQVKYVKRASVNDIWYCTSELIKKAPDNGNTAQRAVGYLMDEHNKLMAPNIIVAGTEDSASKTSTTGKKPGDLSEETKDGEILKVYEVTVKPFNYQRIQNSYDCVCSYNRGFGKAIDEIVVLCRKEDCPEEMERKGSSLCLGTYSYKGITYFFWNIFEYLYLIIQHTPPQGRIAFLNRLTEYVNRPNTSEHVRVTWKENVSQIIDENKTEEYNSLKSLQNAS